MQKDTYLRSILKAISWRFFGSLATSVIVYCFTRKGALALAVGGVEVVAKIGIFFVHERIWEKLSFGKKEVIPPVLWFTGLPCSGKTTLSKSVAEAIEKKGWKVEILDGDSIRKLFPQMGFTRKDRDEHIRRIGLLASRLQAHGVVVVASFVSPYRDSRAFVRGLCQNFVEIYVSTPLAECEKRDVKGMYAKARLGQIKGFTGIDDPYESPLTPEIEVDTSGISLENSTRQILTYLDSATIV